LVEGNYQEALSNFEYGERLDPYNGNILINLGATYYNLGVYNKVEGIFRRAENYIKDKNIYLNLGLYYMNTESYKEAEEEFKYAIHLDPKFTKVYYSLGYLYFIQEDYDSAAKQWNKVLEIEPNFSEKYNVLYFIGLTYQKKQMPDKALEYFLEALELAPEGSPVIEEIEKEIDILGMTKYNFLRLLPPFSRGQACFTPCNDRKYRFPISRE
jgi:tetratricopeptide (TPR) repeat protein